MSEDVPVYFVDRSFSDDELNLLILRYATIDGEHVYRREKALTSFQGGDIPIEQRLEVSPDDLVEVVDPTSKDHYRDAAQAIRSDME